MDSDNDGRRWQFSLRSFLFAVLIVGFVAGVIVPIVWESITEWKPPPSPNSPQSPVTRTTPSMDSAGYYETGETPLY